MQQMLPPPLEYALPICSTILLVYWKWSIFIAYSGGGVRFVIYFRWQYEDVGLELLQES